MQGELLSRSTTHRWRTEFGEEYLGTAEAMTKTAAEARTAYYEAVAAAQIATMFDQTLDAEKAAAELANEQYLAGTTSRLDQARQHLAYAETFKAAAEAKRDAVAKREALNRLLKVWGPQTSWVLPGQLPDLPATRPELGDVESYAATHSLAVYAGRASPSQLTAGATLRSEVREHYHRMLTAYDIAKHQRDIVVPLTEVALGELQLNYNAMLLDVYELLDATREQIEAGKEYVTTLADFWIAYAKLTELLGGRLPEPPATTTAAAAAKPATE
jgi:outer membrane protein TolC